jgi:cell division protease FtsH
MLDEMCAALGGRAAEKVIFNKISTGALSDLEKVTKQARAMVTVYGLNDKIGNLTYHDSSGQNEYNFQKPYSERTSELIDKEISNLIEQQYERAIELLEANKDKLTQLAEILLEKEVIFKDNLEEIFGKRPYKSRDEIMNGNSQETQKPVREETVTEKSVPAGTDSSESSEDKSAE